MDIDDITDDNYPGLSVPWLTKNDRLVVSAWPCGVAANWSNITQQCFATREVMTLLPILFD